MWPLAVPLQLPPLLGVGCCTVVLAALAAVPTLSALLCPQTLRHSLGPVLPCGV
jgi:hypothetical protein